jgi:hypothetical protein
MGALHWEFRSDEDLCERVIGRAKNDNRERTAIRVCDCLRLACARVVITRLPAHLLFAQGCARARPASASPRFTEALTALRQFQRCNLSLCRPPRFSRPF